MVALTLRVAQGMLAQQEVLDRWLADQGGDLGQAVVAEGALFPLQVPENVRIERLAGGCVCCLGAVPLRVVLTRVLRGRPARLLLMVSDSSHLPAIRRMISEGRFGPGLALEDDDESTADG
jgi:hypothetical protein